VRIIWFALCFVGGAGVALYGIAWLLLPDARDGSILVEEITLGHVTPGFVLSVLMVLSGVTGSTATIPIFGVGLIVTIVLIIAAVALLSSQARWGQTWENGWRYDEATHQYARDSQYHNANRNAQPMHTEEQQTEAAGPETAGTPSSSGSSGSSGSFNANPFAQQPQAPAQPLTQPWDTHTPQPPVAPPAPKYYETRKPTAPAIISVIYGVLFLLAAAAAFLAFLVPASTGYTGAQWFAFWVLAADVIVGLSMIILGIAGRRTSSVGWMVAPLLVLSIFAVPPVNASINAGHTSTIVTATVMADQSYTSDDFDSISSGTSVVMSNMDINLSDWSTSSAAASTGTTKNCPTGDLTLFPTMSSVTIEVPKGCAWSTTDMTTIAATIEDNTGGVTTADSPSDTLIIKGRAAFSSIEINN
jgi:ABC-type transport system involved in multi-copper enzyme maturation permease subunit